MPTRHDVTRVRLQGGYIAKQCPVRIQNEVLQPAEPDAVPPEVQYRMDEGNRFELEALREVEEAAASRWRRVADLGPAEAIAATVDAMEQRAPIIAGGWLPADSAGRRTGRPDLLVWAGDGYVPVDVKHHRTLDVTGDAMALVSHLADPTPAAARHMEGVAVRRHKGDALQLAHYRRMLQVCGRAATSPFAGILGTEQLVVWYDLDEPIWQTPAKSDGRRRKQRTSMEVYDFEFDFRLDIAAVALGHLDDPDVDLLVEPLHCSECAACPWRTHCGETLRRGAGDPSLIPGIGYQQWRPLRDAGITDRRQLADLHYPTAVLAADGVDLSRLLAAAAPADPDTAVADLIPRAKRQQQTLADSGIGTAGQVMQHVDAKTVEVAGGSWLPLAILHARAALGPEPLYRLPGSPDSPLERYDVEIDVDMENTPDGVYLWGALVTDRAASGVTTEGYRPFFTWEPLTRDGERAVFARFWGWLSDLIADCDSRGLTTAAYCWFDGAENPEMRRLAHHDPAMSAAVEELLTSNRWVDLHRVFKQRWTVGGPSGLKAIAGLAGYRWPVDDPGGGISMVRHAEATGGGPAAGSAREWLLAYNRGDVEATLAVREWLWSGHASHGVLVAPG